MVERCIKCRNEIHLCTCFICPQCGEPIEILPNGQGVCLICEERPVFDLDGEESDKVSSFFTTFKNILRENLPFEDAKKIFMEEIANSGRRTLIKTLGGVPREDVVSYEEEEEEDDNEIKIEGPERRIEMIKCPICNVHISTTEVRSHACFQ